MGGRIKPHHICVVMSKTPCEGRNSQLFFSKTVEQASDQYICNSKSLTVLVFLAVTIKQVK